MFDKSTYYTSSYFDRFRDAISSEYIVVNLGGTKFRLFKSQLNRQPDSRLTDLESLSSNFRSELNEYYFDRNPRAFKAIANYYKTGKLHLPRVHVKFYPFHKGHSIKLGLCGQEFIFFHDIFTDRKGR